MCEHDDNYIIEESEEIKNWLIPEWNIDTLRSRLAKINKKAARHGFPELTLIENGTSQIKDPSERMKKALEMGVIDEIPMITVYDVTIEGEPAKIEGYEFVGTLDHVTLPGKIVIRTVPGKSIPKEMYEGDAVCDHCNKIRRRNETFVLRREEDNKFIRVGRRCVVDYIGHDPRRIVGYLDSLAELRETCESEEGFEGGGGGQRYYQYDHLSVLEKTVAVVRTFGWVPRSKADYEMGITASADKVLDIMLPAWSKENRKHKDELIASIQWDKEVDAAEAVKALAWLDTQTPDNEYMHNLISIKDADAVPTNMFGYWCSVVAVYQRAEERLKLQELTKRTNEWAGEVGDKIELKVHVATTHSIEGQYGMIRIFKMFDEEGRTLTWFANTGNSGMGEGGDYTIKGTIKKCDEFKDWKQTVLTRVCMVKEETEE